MCASRMNQSQVTPRRFEASPDRPHATSFLSGKSSLVIRTYGHNVHPLLTTPRQHPPSPDADCRRNRSEDVFDDVPVIGSLAEPEAGQLY